MPTELSEKGPEKSSFSESERWKELRKVGLYWAIKKSEEAGMAPEELKKFVLEDLSRLMKRGDRSLVSNFLNVCRLSEIPSLSFTEEEINEIKEKSARNNEKRNEAEEVEEKDLKVTLSRDATMADLFRAIDKVEEKKGVGELHFEEELWNNFSAEIAEEVLSLLEDDERASEAEEIKVIEFFERHGYDKSDITTFLPIKFRRKKKNEH